MSKSEFLDNLSQRLRVLPESERRDALEYYDGYISDAENEYAAIAQLGTPGEVAANILANYVESGTAYVCEKTGEKRKASGFSGMKTALVIILALFALPVGLPLVIGIAAIAFGLFIMLLAIVFSVAVAGASLLFAGIAGLFMFPFVIFSDFGYGIALAGTGMISLGLGILVIKITPVLMRGFPRISRFVSRKIIRRSEHGQTIQQ